MDLDTLIFRVNTDQLDEARIKIAKLGDAVGALNKPLQDMARSSAKTNEVIAKSELAAEKARVAQKSLSDTVSQSTTKVDPLTKLMEKLNNTYIDMSQGMSKGESSILNQARNLGAMGDQLQAVASILQNIKTLNKDPFDASLGGVRSITQEFERLQQRADLAQQGILMTTKQLGEYSKLSAEAKGRVVGMGLDPESVEGQKQYNELLSASQKEYLNVLQVVKQLTDEEKKRLDVLKEQERLQQAAQSASAARMQEWAKGVGGKSPELTSMAAFYKEQEVASRKLAAAEDDLILREQKLAFVNKELAAGLTTASANALFKYQKDLEALGKSADEVSQRMMSFRAGLVEKQGHSPLTGIANDAKAAREQVDHLSRAIGVQLGDVAVSLAGGMNPFLVLIQQGDQLRFAVQAARDAGQDLEGAMKKALSGIVMSFIDTGKVIGGFFINSMLQAGKAVTDFAINILFANKTIQAHSLAVSIAADSGNKLASFLVGAFSRIPMLIGAAAGSVTIFAGIALAAFFAVEKQMKALTTSLILTGGSLGTTTDTAVRMAQSMEQVGVSSSKALDVMTAMAKQGGFASREIELVTKSAVDMQKWLGVSVEDTVKQFSKLKGEPVEALIEIAKQTGLVDSATLATVISLAEQGRTAEAAAVAMKAYGDVTVTQVQRAKQEYTEFAQLMIGIGEGLGKFWDNIKSLWIKATPSLQLAGQIDKINRTINDPLLSEERKTSLEAKRDELVKQYLLLEKKNLNEEQSLLLNTESAKVMENARKTTEKYLTGIPKLEAERTAEKNKQVRLEEQLNNKLISQVAYEKGMVATKIAIAKINDDIARENKKNNAESVSAANKHQDEIKKAINVYEDIVGISDGVTKSYNEQVAALLMLGKEGKKSPEEIAKAFGKLEEQQPRFKALVKDFEDYDKAMQAHLSVMKEYKDLNTESSAQLEFRASLLGKTAEEQRLLTIENEKAVALLKAQVKYQKDLKTLTDSGLVGQDLESAKINLTKEYETQRTLIAKDANLKIAEDYQKQFEAIQKELGDVMFLALTNRGAQAGKKLRDLIKAELMKPITLVVNAVVNTLLGQVSGALGLSTGSAGSALSVASNLSGLTGIGSAFGTAFGSAAMSTLGLGGSSAAMTTSLANAGYWSGGAAATSASSLGASIGAYAPYALAAVVALDQLGILDRWSGDPDAFLVQQATGVNQQFASSTQSRLGTVGFVNGSATIMRNGRLVSEYGETEGITTSAQRAALDVITALDNAVADTLSQSQIVEISKNLSGWFQKSWSVESGTIENFIASRYETILGTLDSSFGKLKDYQKEGEKLSDTAVRLITTFTTVKTVFENIGVSIDGLTYKAANDFATVFGGVDKLGSSLSKFYDTFYTEAEKTVNLAKNTTEAFNTLGLALPSSRDAFKELVKSTINAGNPQLLASLLSLQDAFVLLTESAEAAGEEVASESIMDAYVRLKYAATTTEDIAKQRIDIEQRLFEATATQVQIQAKARDEIDSYNLGIYDSMIAAEKAKLVEEERLAAEKVITEERLALQNRLFEATATQSEIQAKARSEINDSNKALYDQVIAAEEASNASKQLADTMQQLADSIINEVNRLKGAILGDVGVSGGVSGLTSEFATLTAQARAGDMKAIEKLPEYSQAIEQAVASTAANASDVVYARAWLAASLGNTADVISGADTSMQPTALTSLAASTVTNGASVISTSATSQSELIAILVAEIQGLRAEVRADVSANTKTSKILERANQDGESLNVTVI